MPEKEPIKPLVRRDEEPAFDEPWQAQVLALAENLAAQGVFSRPAWSDALGAALRAADARGGPDGPDTYYRSALEALEGLLRDGASVPSEDLERRTEVWRQAYLNTPHGQPVELAAGIEGSSGS